MTLSFKSHKLKVALTIFKNKVRLIYGLNIMIGIVGLWAITMTLIIEYIEPSPHWFIALLVGLLPLSIIKIYKTDLEGKLDNLEQKLISAKVIPKRDQGLLSLLAHQLIMPNPSHPPNPIMLALMSERSVHLAPHIKSNTPKIPFDHLTLCILVTLWLAPSVWYHLDFSSHQALQLSTPNQSSQTKTTKQRPDPASKVEQVTKIERSIPSIFKKNLNRQKSITRVNQQGETHQIDQRHHDQSMLVTKPSKALEDMKSKSRRRLGQIGGIKSGGVDGYQNSQNRRFALELAKSLPRKSANVPKASISSNVVRDPRQQALKFGLRRTLMLNDYPPVLRKLIVHTQSVSQESNTTLSPKQ